MENAETAASRVARARASGGAGRAERDHDDFFDGGSHHHGGADRHVHEVQLPTARSLVWLGLRIVSLLVVLYLGFMCVMAALLVIGLSLATR